ncbi:restriction endonuclease subunit S [Methylococcus sp. EFPC2]|uniref:restriction endonuclease subunit S n=1 Tax=Methylococcus sp. EFPC2 TaxID=2812648 RepID=UPI0019677591|nr:restriction endonuclease subunit S [Methylococcus sp. EFPC2]QSA99342.1 restriction endonuclease subunit S [Methylococcus sp. EFPC2]
MSISVSAYPSALLGEVCRFVGGGTPSKKREDYFSGNIPWATVKDFKTFRISDTEDHISEAGLANSASNLVPTGTVLLVTRVGLGKVAIAEQPLAINQDIKAVIPKSEILPDFLFWFLLSQGAAIERMGAGATVKGVTLNDVRAIKIPVPPIPEQRRIADILSRAEGIVRLRREAQKKAAEIIPALFLDMFGDPATNPKRWRMTSVGQIATYTRYGPRFPDRQYSDKGAHILRTTDMGYSGELRWFDAPILPMSTEELEKYSLQPGTLLITRTGATIGKMALFNGAERPCIAGAYLIEVGLSGDVVPEFVLHFFLGQFGQSQLIGGSRAVAQPNINAPTIRAIPIPVPDFDIQEAFADQVAEIESIQSQQTSATQKAEAVFDALLARTFIDS